MSEPTCINLDAMFGRRYRISWEANDATRSQWAHEDWLWLMEIRCRYGVVYPKGGELLQAMTDCPRIGAQLRRCGVLSSCGDSETIVTFNVTNAPAVFALLKPYRRRQVSAAERERLAALGSPFRFGAGHGVQSEHSKPGSTIKGENGQVRAA